MPPIAVSNFKDCFVACDKDSRCSAFAFLGGDGPGNCYLKNHIGAIPYMAPSDADAAYITSRGHYTAPSQPSGTSSRTNSSPSGTTSPTIGKSCAAVGDHSEYTDGAGRKYKIECGTDHNGGDLDHKDSDSFSGCFTICDQTPGCVGFAYVGGSGPGICYLKSSITPYESNPAVGYAMLVGAPQGSNPPAVANGGCDYLKSYSKRFDGYKLECQVDHVGGDLSHISAGSFEQCFSECDAISGCLGFAYVGGDGPGICYFKSEITESSRSATVDFAVRKGKSGSQKHTSGSASKTHSKQHETSTSSSRHVSSTASPMTSGSGSNESTATSEKPSSKSSHTSPSKSSRSSASNRSTSHRSTTTTRRSSSTSTYISSTAISEHSRGTYSHTVSSSRSKAHSSTTTSVMPHPSRSTTKSERSSVWQTTATNQSPSTTSWGGMHPSQTMSSHHSTITPPPTASTHNGVNGTFFTALGRKLFAYDDRDAKEVEVDIADYDKQEYKHFFDLKQGGSTTIAGETFSAFPTGHGIVVDDVKTYTFTHHDAKPSIPPPMPSSRASSTTMRTVLRPESSDSHHN